MKQLLTAVARLFEDDENVHKKCRDNVLMKKKVSERAKREQKQCAPIVEIQRFFALAAEREFWFFVVRPI